MRSTLRVGKTKVKKKCCRSKPRCKRCPVTALLKQRQKAVEQAEKAARKAEKGARKAAKAARKAGKSGKAGKQAV